MVTRKTAAERAAEEAAAVDPQPVDGPGANPDGADGNDQLVAPENVEPESDDTGDADALRYDADREGAPEPTVHRTWPHAARGNIATQLLAAATVLGYPADVVRSTSDGFRYPENIDRYLFPSEYDA